ncbi:hypothetical protein PACTADRAFT_48551 [Pachysolen tannophilus NRRL Y-2460]|uniref:Prenylcysteine lyase domain-containing protein n=1 Tax=Pachysolen tannophilus NRRL Y-2460 TaxID=669874 RepID=A0A1E4TYB2_PACTA|nr:hypothetical protein PACTADRAFT_48551 [Pachysolen tannophilus NRRL Y-2460]
MNCFLVLLILVTSFSFVNVNVNVNALENDDKNFIFEEEQKVLQYSDNSTDAKVEKLAIIGAGAAGSSAAYHLQYFTNHLYNVTIFEKANYVGGRSTTISNFEGSNDNDDIDDFYAELGASIFIKDNKILSKAVDIFNLTLQEFSVEEKYPDLFDGSFGIWNGNKFVFEGQSNSLWSKFKFWKKYGYSPIKAYRANKNLIRNKFLKFFYDNDEHFPFDDLNKINIESGLIELTNKTGKDYLTDVENLNQDFIKEFVQATTRVNYAQNIDQLHALGSAVTLAAAFSGSGLQVKGGNYKIFEKFISFSENNQLLLNSQVNKIELMKGDENWKITYNDGVEDFFNQVLIASPYHTLQDIEIDIPNKENEKFLINNDLAKVEFVKLHVLILKSKEKLSSEYFNSTGNLESLPEFIMTTQNDADENPPFFSINIIDYNNDTDNYIYKIFSPIDMTLENNDFKLSTLFKENNYEILKNHLWESYPYLVPKNKFDTFKLHEDGLWYLNTMESFISTMETSALMGANVAALISNGKNTTNLIIPIGSS